MIDDVLLLEAYAAKGDEAAFRELVERHLPMVYSAALRQVAGDQHLAKDVAQDVFHDFARKAPKLMSQPVVAGWLYRATRFAAAKAVRSEVRRRVREAAVAREQQTDVVSASPSDDTVGWDALCGHLDAALDKLGANDRDAILLRFFRGFDFRHIGAALKISDDTAQKRVTRALDKLRRLLVERGVALSIPALGTLLLNNAVGAPPAGLGPAIVQTAGAALAAHTVAGVSGFLFKMGLGSLRRKFACGFAVTVAGVIVYLLQTAPTVVTYDLSRDFPTSAGSGSVWSLGWTPTLGGTFSSLKHLKRFPSDNGVSLMAWQVGDIERPAVGRNVSERTAISAGGAFVGPPGTIWFGATDDDSVRNFGVIRFTVPPDRSGKFRVNVAVRSLFEGAISGDVEFHVLKNGSEQFGRFLDGNNGASYSAAMKLTPGDTVDFVAGRGRTPNDDSAGLKIRATLTSDLSAPAEDLAHALAVPPVFVSSPTDCGEPLGGTAIFEVGTGGSWPLSYQWWFGGSLLVGATNNTLRLSDLQTTHAGEYHVVVSNAAGIATSSVARLAITTCAPVPRGLVSCWSAEGTAADRLGGQHGTRLPGTTTSAGRVGRAFLFQGLQAGVQVPANPVLDVGSSDGFTVEAWIRPDAVTGKIPLIGWNSESNYGVNLSIVSGRLYANLRDETGVSHAVASPANAIIPGRWRHIALTFDAPDQSIRLYCDGEIVANEHVEIFRPNTRCDLQFGRRRERDSVLTYSGLMDEIFLFRRALTHEEITAIAAAGGAGKCISSVRTAAASLASPGITSK